MTPEQKKKCRSVAKIGRISGADIYKVITQLSPHVAQEDQAEFYSIIDAVYNLPQSELDVIIAKLEE